MASPYNLPLRPRDRRFAAAIGALFIPALLFSIHPRPVSAAEPTVRILLSKPPHRTSSEYSTLSVAAGSYTVEPLNMSGAEVWSLPPHKADQILEAARRLRVSASLLERDPAMALKGMTGSVPMSRSERAMMTGTMSQPGVMGAMMAEIPQAGMMEYALTALDDAGAPLTVRLSLTDDLTVDAVRRRLETSEGGYIWHGTIAGSDEPVTLMWWPDGRLTGQVSYRNMSYQIRHFGSSMHGVIAVSPRQLPPEHAPMPAAMMKKMNMDRDPLVREGSAEPLHAMMRPSRKQLRHAQDVPPATPPAKLTVGAGETHVEPARGAEPIELTLLVAYTPKAARLYSDIRRDLIALAVEEANASFARSGIGHIRIRLVHTYRTRYRENATHFEHLFRFADAGDGIMEEVHRKRNRYAADLAILIVDDANGCGLSAGIGPPADRAFAVVHHGCAAVSYSLAHEIGHLLGARHDRALDDGGAPFPYGHGYVHRNEWRTMMSYEESCGKCPRLPVWSNPDLKVRGAYAGSADTNNARVLSERAAIVARYR